MHTTSAKSFLVPSRSLYLNSSIMYLVSWPFRCETHVVHSSFWLLVGLEPLT